MGTVFQHRSPSLFLTPGLAGNQAPSFRAAHYITPARRSQATSTMAAPSPPVHDPITTADHSTPELPQPSHLATLCCHALPDVRTVGTRATLERLFRECGLPQAIRSDNGVPFASTGIHGLCELNVWWMKLGIVHQRITPASPQENGAHERMHRTLKDKTTRPPAANRRGQQWKVTAAWTPHGACLVGSAVYAYAQTIHE
jgi:hypothetical protein